MFGGAEFGVRALGALLFALGAGAAGFWRRAAVGSARAGAYAAICWLALPLSAGAALATPDAPLTLFSLIALVGLIEVYRGRALGWAIVGPSLGLALLSKFTALFLVAGAGLALVAVPTLRGQIRKPWPYLAGLAAAAIFSPFVAWNATHGWMTFAKQFGRVPASGFRPFYVVEFLAAQFELANPLLVVSAAAGTRSEPRRLLVAYIAPALAYFLVHALHDRVQGNWTAPLFPALAMLMGDAAANGPSWAQKTAKAGIALGVVVLAAVYLHVATDWPALGAADPLARIGGWRELRARSTWRARERGAALCSRAAMQPLRC